MIEAAGILTLISGIVFLLIFLLILLISLGAILLVVFLISASYNTAIMFAVQKIFFKSFFSKIKAKQVMWTIVDITITNLLLYLVMLFAGSILLMISPKNMIPILLTESGLIFAVDFLLLHHWEIGKTKQIAGIALALGLLSNPFTIFYLIPLAPWIIFLMFAVVIAGVIIGAKIFNKSQAEKEKKVAKPTEKVMTSNASIILLLIVVFVLAAGVFIVWGGLLQPRWANIVCNSSDPAKIMMKASQINSTPKAGEAEFGTILLVNLTGGNISNIKCTGDKGFAPSVGGCSATLESGDEIRLKPTAGMPGTYSSSTIKIDYKDYADLQRSATITCSGPITIS